MSLTVRPTAWYDPSNGVVSTNKDDPRFTPLGQLLPLYPVPEAPLAPKELNEASLNELVGELKKLGSPGRFKPTHMLFDEKALEYCKKLERDDPETNFVNHTLAVHVGYRYQSPVGGWEYGDHIPAGFDTQKWAHQKIYILQEQS